MAGQFRDMANFAGAKIDKYLFDHKLGSGGFADVYLAQELGPGRKHRNVAIKVFVDDIQDRDSFRATFEEFRRDLEPLIDLSSHSPVVQYFTTLNPDIYVKHEGGVITLSQREATSDSGIVLTAYMIVMEYADGGSLGAGYHHEVIIGRCDNSHLDHFIDVCSGLKHAHTIGLVHRDIKPQNLFWFRRENKVKIGDFGIAKYVDDTGIPSQYLVGSLNYLSPEAFQANHPATPQRDVYALGCTLYELFTGQKAFTIPPNRLIDERDGQQLLNAYEELHRSAPRPDSIGKDHHQPVISFELNSFLKQMMAVDPAVRPSLDEVIAALRNERQMRTVNVPLIIEDSRNREIPKRQAVVLSDNLVNPQFRQQELKESLYFVFVNIEFRTDEKLRILFNLLDAHFGQAYSCCEVFGRYDFLFHMWSARDSENVVQFHRNLLTHVLDGNANNVSILSCEEVQYFGTSRKQLSLGDNSIGGSTVTDVLVKLHEAQERGDEEAKKWLVQKAVYVRKVPQPSGRGQIRCFTLIEAPTASSEGDREDQHAMIVRAIESSEYNVKKLDITMCRKAYRPVAGVRNEPSDFVVSYLSPSFEDCVTVPEIILEQVPRLRLRTVTLLATQRFFVTSDRVQISRKYVRGEQA